jgi:hypothetical protein
LKSYYEGASKNKFIIDDVKVEKKTNYNKRKREGSNAMIRVNPTKINGYKWEFNKEDKEKEFSEEEAIEAREWVKNMLVNLRDFAPEERVRILYNKWIILQRQTDIEACQMVRTLMDEAISQTYEIRDF